MHTVVGIQKPSYKAGTELVAAHMHCASCCQMLQSLQRRCSFSCPHAESLLAARALSALLAPLSGAPTLRAGHAPTCLSMSIANNATGEMICENKPSFGGQNPADKHDPNRPGTGRAADRFEETGFIAVPPCLWGSPEHGLDPPPSLEGLTLRIVKKSNATYGHHGEMAHGQFYYASEL